MAASHRHHSGLDPNDTSSRVKHATGQGFEHTIPARHVFGTPEEIGARVGGTFPTLPDRHATNFRQLGPKGGGTITGKGPQRYMGNQKFGNPRRYA